ncbi:MAG: TRAP transporter small permease [Candidatus Thiodiazotropha lotti]|uniref:TRAP transporter small permease protein n=1 Tax=Candidatus Thiodiazotropha lotti TaxID=2792787 RepID=A0A9E4K6L4_9GAMM|nr:TRAP transporter small permease [Candidatus Thiodiazotropha lotti]ODC01433.1 C4-dicarboxylate ABC transporter substrate-binding protein [Candidatus Thiodiazotropha endoloripes]MCG7920559.1 TRAP transporter small permease [Candidatus Thiodiazotropha lotti]MCG7930603.1 TRAP transporter small permease [Candidatus Thiodiazotropha lotti]MCG7940119.1 TRAP transporter small permease [Candidatus Thiodiazotropha lotti]
MSNTATILNDESRLSLADRLFFRLESLLNLIGGIAIFLLVILATINVLGRWLFSMPIDGYVDWVEQAMAFIAFLGIAYTKRLGGHIRMDILIGQLHGRLLWFAELFSVVLMLLVTLILIYGSYLHFWRAYDIGDSSLDINLPTWPAKLVVPLALSVLALRLILQIWGYARAFKEGGEQPVAVPLIENAATVAAKEAESVMGEIEGNRDRS